MNEPKNIVFLLYRYSVVVKGIEKRLEEMGFNVETLTEDFSNVDHIMPATDLFMFYLPDDILDNYLESRELAEMVSKIRKNERRMLFIGEKKYHDEVVKLIPEIEDYLWLDRPVDNQLLKPTIDQAMARGGIPNEKKRVLIVDDDPSYAGMVKAWIEDMYKVNVVTTGMLAISFALKNKVDLILLDYEMPVVDGPQVLQMLREDPQTKDIPVVFLTGVSTQEGVRRVMSLKPDGYILKSTTHENLVNYLKSKL